MQSNGIGQQSWALYFMSSLGVIPRFDYSIFADPGREDKRSYEYLRYAMEWAQKNNGVPLIRTGKRSLYRDLMNGVNSRNNRFASIPAFTLNDDGSSGMLQRQCTQEYKVAEFNRCVRKILNLRPRQHFPEVKVYNAITVDELSRVAAPEIKKFIHVYPFCNLSVTRESTKFLHYDVIFGKSLVTRSRCVQWLSDNGFDIPPKSSCTFCPYQSDAQWLDKKLNDPKEWRALVKLDKKIRNSTAKGVNNPIYLHRSLKPLDEVYLKEDQTKLFGDCEGNCDV